MKRTMVYKDWNGKTVELKEGDILYTSWGYDQTNVEFFRVVKINGKKFFTVQELNKSTVETGFMNGDVMPIDNPRGKPVKAYQTQGYLSLCAKFPGDYKRSLRVWDGESKRASWYG